MIFAHGIGGRSDLPIPLSMLLTGAATILVITFVSLAVLWPRPRLQEGPRYDGSARHMKTGWLGWVGLAGLLLVLGQPIIRMFGVEIDSTRPTIAPVLVWVYFWLVVPFAGAVIGNWYADINPWRFGAGLLGVGKRERSHLERWIGIWPALAWFIGFTWMELVYPRSGDPVALGIAALVYTVALLVTMQLVGRDTGLAVFDAFTLYNRLISAISPLGRRDDGRIVWRGWLRSLPVLPEWPGLWVFVAAMIGTVSYDGASGTSWFETITGGLTDTRSGRTVLLIGSIAVVAATYLAASAVAARLGEEDWTAMKVAQRFAHTLVPIALAYAVSHYLTLIIFEGQQLVAAISDPFGLGWDIFGTASWKINYFISTSTPIWFVQVAFIVGGHLVAVVLAHDRSLVDFGRDAVRSQYAMLALMIALTSLGLVILSG